MDKVGNEAGRSVVFLFNSEVGGSFVKDGAKLGDMPINRKWGYMFEVNGAPDARTLAHELGHGRLTLRHTFATEHCGGTSGHTNNHNLMDYGSGTGLNRFQWETAHNPAPIGKVFQDDEDGGAWALEAIFEDDITDWENIETEGENIGYYTPSGKIIVLPASAKPKFNTSTTYGIPSDALIGFRYNGNDYYASYYEKSNGVFFRGYYTKKAFSIFGVDFKYTSSYENIFGAVPTGDAPVNLSNAIAIGLSGGEIIKTITYSLKDIQIGSGIISTSALAWTVVYTMPLFLVSDTRQPGPYEGQIVDILPYFPFSAKDHVDVAPIPVAIPHSIPNNNGNCHVYVIFVQDGASIDIAKYGQTCQSECDRRPDIQCQDFNKDLRNNGKKYFWTWFARDVTIDVARMLEYSLTATYVIANDGRLPEKHGLPCFTRGGSEKFGKRVDLANKHLDDMKNLYGTGN